MCRCSEYADERIFFLHTTSTESSHLATNHLSGLLARGQSPRRPRPRSAGRRAGELITLIDELDKRGIGFREFNSPMDTTTPAGGRAS